MASHQITRLQKQAMIHRSVMTQILKILQPALLDPYWVVSLEMDNAEADINQMLSENQNEIKFSFPSEQADYLPLNIVGWAPANQNMIIASRDILSKFEEILDVTFTEADSTSGLKM